MGKYEKLMKVFEENIESEINKVVKWIKDYVNNAHAKGVVVGMSGGIDCSVVARLCQKAGVPVLLIMLPSGNSMNLSGDINDSMEFINKFGFKYINCPITNINKSVINEINSLLNPSNLKNKIELSEMAISNINPRLRMTVLYTIAQSMDYLVIGTDNLSEYTMGYFTKWGDGGYDFNPLVDFTKTEVRILGKYLELPERIISKPPSANLWEGQTDEDEMGLTYKELDTYILTGEGTADVVNKIEDTKRRTAHKRLPISTYIRK